MPRQQATHQRARAAGQTDTPAADLPPVDPAAATSAERARLSGPALRTFLAIADEWGLTERERLRVLGQPGRSTLHSWAAKARAHRAMTLPLDTLLRISAVLGIYKALKIVFPRDADARAWLEAENAGTVFGGRSPRALMTAGTQDDLMQLRRYLDAWRGGRFTAPVPGIDDAGALGDDDIVFV